MGEGQTVATGFNVFNRIADKLYIYNTGTAARAIRLPTALA